MNFGTDNPNKPIFHTIRKEYRMSENEFNELVDELKNMCFTVSSGYIYMEECLELYDVVELLRNKLKIK